MKQRLTERLVEEVLGSYSYMEYQSLKKEFRERTGCARLSIVGLCSFIAIRRLVDYEGSNGITGRGGGEMSRRYSV